MNLRRLPALLIGVTAAVFAAGMILGSRLELLAMFRLADPTGYFGMYFAVCRLLANLCVILLFVGLMRRSEARLPLSYAAVFSFKLAEAVALLPCLIGKPEALCGVLSLAISEFTSPLILVAAVLLIFTSEDKALKRSGFAAGIVLIAAATASYAFLAPKTAEACRQISDISGRGACLEKFALKQADTAICRAIELRSSRLECLRKIAEQARRPEICAEIHDPPGTVIAPYETPDVQTRSLCYYVLAFDLKRRDLCLKVEANDQRQRCLTMFPEGRQ